MLNPDEHKHRSCTKEGYYPEDQNDPAHATLGHDYLCLRGKQIAKYLSTLRAVMFRIVEYVQHSLTNWKSLQSTLPKFQGRYLQILYKSRGMQRKNE